MTNLVDILFMILTVSGPVFALILFIDIFVRKQRSTKSYRFIKIRFGFLIGYSITAFLCLLAVCLALLKGHPYGNLISAFGSYIVAPYGFISASIQMTGITIFIYHFLYGLIRSIKTVPFNHALLNLKKIIKAPEKIFFLVPKILLILIIATSLMTSFLLLQKDMTISESLEYLSIFFCGSLFILSILTIYFIAELLNWLSMLDPPSIKHHMSFLIIAKYSIAQTSLRLAIMYLLIALIPGFPMISSLLFYLIFYFCLFLFSTIAIKNYDRVSHCWPQIILVATSFGIGFMNLSCIALIYIVMMIYLAMNRPISKNKIYDSKYP